VHETNDIASSNSIVQAPGVCYPTNAYIMANPSIVGTFDNSMIQIISNATNIPMNCVFTPSDPNYNQALVQTCIQSPGAILLNDLNGNVFNVIIYQNQQTITDDQILQIANGVNLDNNTVLIIYANTFSPPSNGISFYAELFLLNTSNITINSTNFTLMANQQMSGMTQTTIYAGYQSTINNLSSACMTGLGS
jgi:hypothetical protein